MIGLIVNADDFGFTRDVNDGILQAHRNGILTSTTLMANGGAFEHAIGLAKRTPTLDVGAHLVLIQGESLAEPGRALPRTTPELLMALGQRKIEPYREFQAQMQRLLAAGIFPTHLDTHKHTHLAWPVLSAVIRIARDFGVRWIRKPFDRSRAKAPASVRLVNALINTQRAYFTKRLARAGVRTTDYFEGFQLTGRLGTENLAAALEELPEGLTEFMCHPGYLTEELAGAPTRLREARARELEALCADEVKAVVVRRGIQLATFS